MSQSSYNPETYWAAVGRRIEHRRDTTNVIAGDDEPYYRYKRKRFLKMLHAVDFKNRVVLEIGSGPGGNLVEVLKENPEVLKGVDISQQMVSLASQKLPEGVEVIKINGKELPFEDNGFDIVFTATVLQHNTDERMLKEILKEMCRVSSDRVYLFERIEKTIKGNALCQGRPVSYYADLMRQQGFLLQSTEYINIRVSYYICGAIRKLFNRRGRKEGEPLSRLSVFLQTLILPVTAMLDRVFLSEKDVARLEFRRS